METAMRQLLTWRVLLGLACLGAPAGCQSFNLGESFPSPAPAAANAAKDPVELPPGEKAQVCRATAERLERAGKDPEAIILYERARKADPRMKDIGRRLAVLYDRQGDFNKALEEYQQALERTPKDSDLHNDLGYAYYCRGQWQEAEKHLRQAVSLNPQNARAWINLGLTLGQRERYAESLEAFAKVVRPAQAASNLAFVLTTQGKRQEAKETYRKALELDPGLPIAQAALAKLDKAGSAPGGRDKQAAAPAPKTPKPAAFSMGTVKWDDETARDATPTEWRQAEPVKDDTK
jgi:Tfp pilus assembly protein PilF